MKQGIYLLLLFATVVLSAKIPRQSQWEDFKIKFGKNYRSLSHEAERRNVFMATLNDIEEHNTLYEQGLSTYFQGVNFYSDWTWDEFKNTVLMETTVFENKTHHDVRDSKLKSSAPESADWRDIMCPVKNQGNCGSCWAFAQIGVVEAAWVIAGHENVCLSEQMLLDCGGGTCSGGSLTGGYKVIERKHGVASQSDYPYYGYQGNCEYDSSMKAASISGHEHVDLSIESFKNAISKQPIAIGLYVNTNFQRYGGGIFEDSSCPQNKANHAVIAVGYDSLEGYWTIRNSWGGSWGEDGYIRIVMGQNTCNCEETESTVANI